MMGNHHVRFGGGAAEKDGPSYLAGALPYTQAVSTYNRILNRWDTTPMGGPMASTRPGRGDQGAVVGITAVVLMTALLASAPVEVPIIDDWTYAWSVEHFLHKPRQHILDAYADLCRLNGAMRVKKDRTA
jgi:hypothetical protein